MKHIRTIVFSVALAALSAFAGEYARLSKTFQEFPSPRESLQARGPALAFLRGDSVFLAVEVNTICPVCVGCVCSKTFRTLDSFPLAPAYRGLPLQQAVRVYVNDTGLYFVALGQPPYVRRFAYRYTFNGGTMVGSVTRIHNDSIQLRLSGASTAVNNALVLYGIDTLSVDVTAGTWRFRMFGNQGVRNATYSLGPGATGPAGTSFLSRGADTLTVISSGAGIYGTKEGYVLDPVVGYDTPVSIAPQPILFVNDSGAAGDAGLFALREGGAWRALRFDSAAYRDFRLYRSPQAGSWAGLRAQLWDNRLRARDVLVKDDSTLWSGGTSTVKVHATGVDSALFTLTDAEGNFSAPRVRFQASDTPLPVWGNFQKGCPVAFSGSSNPITCFDGDAPNAVRVSWNSAQVRFRTPIRRGYWMMHYLDAFTPVWYDWQTVAPAFIDTAVSWSRGDTLALQFSNATCLLVHQGPVSLVPRAAAGSSVRLSGRTLQWSLPEGSGGPLWWTLRDVRGNSLRSGVVESRGSLLLGDAAGVYGISFQDREGTVRWQGRLVLP